MMDGLNCMMGEGMTVHFKLSCAKHMQKSQCTSVTFQAHLYNSSTHCLLIENEPFLGCNPTGFIFFEKDQGTNMNNRANTRLEVSSTQI